MEYPAFEKNSLQGRKLLILGANPETASLVVKANDMGIRTYVTDNNPKAYAKRFAAVPLNIDAVDLDRLVAYAKEERIDGILVGVAEALIPVYYEVCRQLDKPCFATMDQFEIMTSKEKFKSVCRQYQVPVVPEYSTDQTQALQFPVVVKPVDSSSSRGISVCSNAADLENGICKALRFSKSGKILIEKRMTGDEVVIYYLIQEGVPSLVAMCDRYTSREQIGFAQLPVAYVFPSIHLKQYLASADRYVCSMLRGMHVQNGTLFLQAFAENGEFLMYEAGFRLNGAQEHILVSKMTGIDAKECLIHYALLGVMSNKKIAEISDPWFGGKFGCKFSPLVREGRIHRIEGLPDIEELPGVLSVNPSYEDGDMVAGKGTLKQIVARFFLAGDSAAMLRQTLDQIQKRLKVSDEDGKSMLLKPFDSRIILERYSRPAAHG